MGQQWDTGETAFAVEFWAEVLRVLKPGGHVVAFGGTRTYHRLACAIEDAGFEIRDQLGWCYGTGFPKSHDVAISFEKSLSFKVDHVEVRDGVPVRVAQWLYRDDRTPMVREAPFRHPMANRWAGWGTALKPAWEPICLARKPLVGSVAENVAAWGVGALNIDGCRISGEKPATTRGASVKASSMSGALGGQGRIEDDGLGRFPANVLHDGSAEVVAAFPESNGQQGAVTGDEPSSLTNNVYGQFAGRPASEPRGDTGSAARFFYSAKASKLDRLGSLHPTVKPVDLMRWLVRLVTPAGGLVLDPFAGSGTTGHAAVCEGRRAVLIEREAKFCRDIVQRMNRMDPHGQPKPRKRPAKPRPPDPWAGTLFAAAMAARRAQTKVADNACALVQNRAIMEEQAQPSSSPPTTDSARAVSDDGQARPAMLHAAE
jgi:site-specific DNA-methyltransferase (adenine-specific)